MNWLLAPRVRPLVLQAALASLLLNLALLVPALHMLQVFDRVFSSRSLETLAMLGLLAALALGLALCMDRVRARLLSRAGAQVDDSLAPHALRAMLVDAARGAGQVDRGALHDVARLRGFLASPAVTALFDAPWMPVHLLVITALHPLLGAAALASAGLLFALGLASERLLRQPAEGAQQQGRRAAQRAEALVHQAEVLLGGGLLAHALTRWQREHADALGAQQQLADRAATLAATGRLLRQAVQVALLTLGAWLVVAGDASPGIMVAATVLLGRALQPVEQLIAGWKALVEVRAAWARLQQQPADDTPAEAMRLPAPRGALSLERASLLAPQTGLPLLKPTSLAIEPGTCLGLIGPSGAGKTTLLRLMLGLRRPHGGTVRLDGVDLQAWPREQWDAAIGYLPQDVQLFAGSVAENIARLGPVDPDRVLEAARLAGVHELIARLPQAYDTELGDGGAQLSGGQRQRIGLARALYGLPRLVVLDEPDAHLDDAGEAALRQALAALKQAGSTVVLVSHRPSLMRHVDRLAVLRDGALESIGPRDEVLGRLARPAVAAATSTPTPNTATTATTEGATVHALRPAAPQREEALS